VLYFVIEGGTKALDMAKASVRCESGLCRQESPSSDWRSVYSSPNSRARADGFRAPLDLESVKDDAVVTLDRVQGKEETLCNLTIRKSLGHEPHYFELALAQWLA